jgi:hypothetical protein
MTKSRTRNAHNVTMQYLKSKIKCQEAGYIILRQPCSEFMMSDDKCLLPCIEAWSLKKEYQILKNPEGIFNPDPDRSQNVNPGGLKHVLHSLHNLKLDSWFCAQSACDSQFTSRNR